MLVRHTAVPAPTGGSAEWPVHVSVSLQRQALRLIGQLADAEDAVAGTLQRMAESALRRGLLADAERLAARVQEAQDRADRARRIAAGPTVL